MTFNIHSAEMETKEQTYAIQIVPYASDLKGAWDQFVDNSKNGTFLLKRNYLEYHLDRFVDNSLVIYKNDTIIALLPATLHNDEVRSHGGLTYGGLIIGSCMTVQLMLTVMQHLIEHLKGKGIKRFIYKRIPNIYYSYPSDEDLYALFRNNAKLSACSISSSILMDNRINFNTRRRRNIQKAIKSGLTFSQSRDYKTYFEIVTEVLRTRHNTSPVHTYSEMELLAGSFPDNIKLYSTFLGDKMLAGVIIYETPFVAHAQYIANSVEGRTCGALDYCFDNLINVIYRDKKYFDFGISTEDKGRFLNEGLIEQKQEFGGRGIVYNEYTIIIE